MGIFDKDILEMNKVKASDVYHSEWVPSDKGECVLSSNEYKKNIASIKLMEGSTIKLPFSWTVLLPYEYRHCSNEISGRAKSLASAKQYVEGIAYSVYPKNSLPKRTKGRGIALTTYAGASFAVAYTTRNEEFDLRYEFLNPVDIAMGDNARRISTIVKTDSRGRNYTEFMYEIENDTGAYEFYVYFIYDGGQQDIIAVYDYDIIDTMININNRQETARRTANAGRTTIAFQPLTDADGFLQPTTLGTPAAVDTTEIPATTVPITGATANIVIADDADLPVVRWLDGALI